jgi:hypothetical protein
VYDPLARVEVSGRFTGKSVDDFFLVRMFMVDHALRTFIAVARVATSIRVELKAAAFLKANENLCVALLVFKVVAPTGLEEIILFSHAGPAKRLVFVWLELDFFGCCIYGIIDEPLFVVGNVTFLQPKTIVFFASAAFALQAPFTLIAFVLPTISFLPINFHLEAKCVELAVGARV